MRRTEFMTRLASLPLLGFLALTLQQAFDELGAALRMLGHEIWRQKGDCIRCMFFFWLGLTVALLYSCAAYDRMAQPAAPAYPKIEPLKPGST